MRFLLASLRHFLATLATVTFFAGLCAAAYIVLLLVAIVFNKGLGSPIAGLAWPLITAFLTLQVIVFVLLPATAISEWLSSSLRWNVLLQIPLATVLLFPLAFVLWYIRGLVAGPSNLGSLIETAAWSGLVLMIPLGVYWWSLKAVELVFRLPAVAMRPVSFLGDWVALGFHRSRRAG